MTRRTAFGMNFSSIIICPVLALPEEAANSVGVWGQRHLRFIRENKRGFYASLLPPAS
jgi:hypothetical protein